ncbi:HAD-IB family phosphatase [Candidatus Bathyarchaeota archaeon]|nr:HAD-IB family phosphatase [Candidatus Bathyarchaeota archaeon]NIV43806.1 HAD-IB family phosphatase [Candidatus Bathyarchaeota archaeon]
MTKRNPERSKPPRLVVFDVEGVLLPKRRYLVFEAARKLSFWRFVRILLIGFLYEIGLTSLESALKRIFRLLEGLLIDDLFQLYQKVPLIYGVEDVFKKLKKTKCKIALISSGLPQPFVETLAAELNADYAYGLDLEIVDNRLTGKISGIVLEHQGKAAVLQEILTATGLTAQDCAVVADDRNNLPMFPLCSLRVGYNSDFLLSIKSDVVVRGELKEILLPLNLETSAARYSSFSKDMVIREAIHISGVLVPLISIYLRTPFMVAFLIFLVTMIYIASEFARIEGVNLPVISTITREAATKPEIHEFVTNPIFFAAGIMLALVLFPNPINYASIAIFTLGDGTATLFGRKLGKTVFPLNKGKRVEGSIFGFLFAFLGALLFVSHIEALVGAAIGMIMEALPTPVNDNLTIPLAAGLALLLL